MSGKPASRSAMGTKADPWRLKTPSGASEYLMYRDEMLEPPILICMVGKTELH